MTVVPVPRNGRHWTQEEHTRYLEALALYPEAPWKVIANHVGTRTTRQVMTHANKIALKIQRRARGLLRAGRPRHDDRTTPSPKPRRVAQRRTRCVPTETPSTESFVDMLQQETPVPIKSEAPPSPVTPGSFTMHSDWENLLPLMPEADSKDSTDDVVEWTF